MLDHLTFIQLYHNQQTSAIILLRIMCILRANSLHTPYSVGGWSVKARRFFRASTLTKSPKAPLSFLSPLLFLLLLLLLCLPAQLCSCSQPLEGVLGVYVGMCGGAGWRGGLHVQSEPPPQSPLAASGLIIIKECVYLNNRKKSNPILEKAKPILLF